MSPVPVRNCFKFFLGSLLLGLAPFWTGCAKDFITGKSTLNYYSLGSDIKLGQYVMTQQLSALKRNNKPLDEAASPKELHRLRRIVQDVAAVSHIPNFPYEVHLSDVDIVNAWCAPGGKIMVYSGLWQPRKGLVIQGNEDEIAAVLAHEIAHATARHVTERLSSISTIALVGEIAASVIHEAGSPAGSDAFRRIFYSGMDVYVPSYSRKSESEADRIGLFYMAKAGYNPQAAVTLWERAAKSNKNDKTSIFSSHPSNGARAAALKKLLPQAMAVYQEKVKKRKRR